MMNIETATHLIFITILLFSLLWMWFFLYRNYFIDVFRENVFDLRDQLFDYAAQGNISFDDPAYYRIRQMMNGSIRFAEFISFWYLIYTGLLRTDAGSTKYWDEIQNEIAKVEDKNVNKQLNYFLDQHRIEIVKLIINRNLFLISIYYGLSLFCVFSSNCKNLFENLRKTFMELTGIRLLENESYLQMEKKNKWKHCPSDKIPA